VWQLHGMGYKLYATAETQPFLASKGIPSTLMYYADSDASPNVKTLISNGDIDLVVNLPTSSSTELKNNYLTRRTAVDFGVGLINNPQIFTMFTDALMKNKEGKYKFTQAASLFDYYQREKEEDSWTSPTEFH
jgi:hypothetical protein